MIEEVVSILQCESGLIFLIFELTQIIICSHKFSVFCLSFTLVVHWTFSFPGADNYN